MPVVKVLVALLIRLLLRLSLFLLLGLLFLLVLSFQETLYQIRLLVSLMLLLFGEPQTHESLISGLFGFRFRELSAILGKPGCADLGPLPRQVGCGAERGEQP